MQSYLDLWYSHVTQYVDVKRALREALRVNGVTHYLATSLGDAMLTLPHAPGRNDVCWKTFVGFFLLRNGLVHEAPCPRH